MIAAAVATTKPVTKPKAKPKSKRVKRDPVRAWHARLRRYRPELMTDTLDALCQTYEKAFDALCRHYPVQDRELSARAFAGFRAGWGGVGIEEAEADWAAVADAPIDELIDVIRPGGLAPTKAPRIQAVLRKIFEERGDFSLEFLGELTAPEALAWLTQIPGIGRKTASVVLLFSFGMPLMPVDRHIERVTKRVGLVPPKATPEQAHDYLQVQLDDERVHEAHVNLITHGRQTCHALRPACGSCAINSRCRYINPKAP